jgi:hypothetical protein
MEIGRDDLSKEALKSCRDVPRKILCEKKTLEKHVQNEQRGVASQQKQNHPKNKECALVQVRF